MTTEKKVARRKLSLLDLAQELRNINKACKVMGYGRQQFYEIRRNYQRYRVPLNVQCLEYQVSRPQVLMIFYPMSLF